MKIRNMIPNCEIRNKRWLFSLPAKSINRWTLPVYLAVAHMKSARNRGASTHRALMRIARLMEAAAKCGDPLAYDVMMHAEKSLRVCKFTKIRDILTPYPAIHNESKRNVTIQVIDSVDALQQQHGRKPTRGEIINQVGGNMSYREIFRQLDRIGWRDEL